MQVQDKKRVAETINKLIANRKSLCCGAPIRYVMFSVNHVPHRICMKCKEECSPNWSDNND